MDKIFSDKINILKALAITLVVSGHLEFRLFDMFPPYSFQLALFFFISGMLFKDKYLDSVAEFWDRCLILMNGKIAAERTRTEIQQKGEDLEDIFFKITEPKRSPDFKAEG